MRQTGPMRPTSAGLLVLALLLFFSPAFGGQDYQLGEGDVVKVTVYGAPDLATTARLDGEGTVQFPLIGLVTVGGLTAAKAAERIGALLADGYLVNPQVSVFVEEFRSNRVVIMGQVNSPGLYELRGRTTLLELLSKAGGLTRDAGERAVIKRRPRGDDPEEQVITVDLKRLVEEGELTLDAPILDGDSIFVGKGGLFYVTGQVRRADSYKHQESTTVIKAVTMAGGFTDKAAMGKVRIIRQEGGVERILEAVPMNEPVLPEDVLVVPESFF